MKQSHILENIGLEELLEGRGWMETGRWLIKSAGRYRRRKVRNCCGTRPSIKGNDNDKDEDDKEAMTGAFLPGRENKTGAATLENQSTFKQQCR